MAPQLSQRSLRVSAPLRQRGQIRPQGWTPSTCACWRSRTSGIDSAGIAGHGGCARLHDAIQHHVDMVRAHCVHRELADDRIDLPADHPLHDIWMLVSACDMSCEPPQAEPLHVLHLSGPQFFEALLGTDVDALLNLRTVGSSKLPGRLQGQIGVAAQHLLVALSCDAVSQDPAGLPSRGSAFRSTEDQASADPLSTGPACNQARSVLCETVCVDPGMARLQACLAGSPCRGARPAHRLRPNPPTNPPENPLESLRFAGDRLRRQGTSFHSESTH